MALFQERMAEWVAELAAEVFEILRGAGYDFSDDYYRPNDRLMRLAEKIGQFCEAMGINTPDDVHRWLNKNTPRGGG